MKKRLNTFLLAGVIGFSASLALAAEGTPWNKLSPEQRALLMKAHEDRWNSMSAEKQQRMLKGAERWQTMTPEERKRVQERRALRAVGTLWLPRTG